MDSVPAQYRFRTLWRLPHSAERVWAALDNPSDWPRWWPGCIGAELLPAETEQFPGRCYRFHWHGRLPYQLTIRVCITEAKQRQRMCATVHGPLQGSAVWTLWEEQQDTCVGFEFAVSGREPWMAYLAPLARPVFRWNHERLMAQGERGLARWLDRRHDSGAQRLQAGLD